jgi:hypothetical protein
VKLTRGQVNENATPARADAQMEPPMGVFGPRDLAEGSGAVVLPVYPQNGEVKGDGPTV